MSADLPALDELDIDAERGRVDTAPDGPAAARAAGIDLVYVQALRGVLLLVVYKCIYAVAAVRQAGGRIHCSFYMEFLLGSWRRESSTWALLVGAIELIGHRFRGSDLASPVCRQSRKTQYRAE